MKAFLNHLDNTFGLLAAGIIGVSAAALLYSLAFIVIIGLLGAVGGFVEGAYTAIDLLWEGITIFF